MISCFVALNVFGYRITMERNSKNLTLLKGSLVLELRELLSERVKFVKHERNFLAFFVHKECN